MKAQAAERMDNRAADGEPYERVKEPTVELKAECTYGNKASRTQIFAIISQASRLSRGNGAAKRRLPSQVSSGPGL